jgi:subtilisin-like proprotein convertase family protein
MSIRSLAVALALSATAASAQTLQGDVIANGAGAVLCDACTIQSPITLTAPGTVLSTGNNVTVRINALSHTYFADLIATLIYTPAAGGGSISARLFDNNGDSGNPNGTYSFNSGFTAPVGSIGYGGGDYTPLESFSVFNGVDVAGTWTLRIVDDAGQDVGSFQSWDLGLVTAAPTTTAPEPGTWALMGTGLLAVGGVAARRRRTA